MFKKPTTAVALDQAIENAFNELKNHDCDSEEYAGIVSQLKKLHEMKSDNHKTRPVSYDTLAMIAANLTGIVLVLKFEQTQIVTGRAITLVRKLF